MCRKLPICGIVSSEYSIPCEPLRDNAVNDSKFRGTANLFETGPATKNSNPHAGGLVPRNGLLRRNHIEGERKDLRRTSSDAEHGRATVTSPCMLLGINR